MPSKFRLTRRLWSDRRGSIAVVFGLSIVALAVFASLAVDGARAYNVSLRVTAALDAAALSGAKQLNETNASDAEVQASTIDTLTANLAQLRINGVTFGTPTVQIDRTNSAVTVATAINLQTLLGGLAGVNFFDFTKSSTTIYDMAQIELVLALDVTGSMAATAPGDSQTKMSALIAASSDLVNSLYDLATTDNNIRIGLVPWSSAVNAGEYADLATGTSSTTSWYQWGWGFYSGGSNNCVVERSGTGGTTDAPPSPLNYAGTAPSSSSCPSQQVLPLIGRTQRSTILSTIASMTPSGATAGHIGTAWGWYMISPEWGPYLPSESKPAAYGGRAIKNVVIMTDGVFNIDYVGGSAVGGYDDTSYSLFQQNCAGMRAKGINIYTIGFDLADTRAVSELQTCAGAPANFYSAGNSAQLKTAFADIVKRLNSVRVTR